MTYGNLLESSPLEVAIVAVVLLGCCCCWYAVTFVFAVAFGFYQTLPLLLWLLTLVDRMNESEAERRADNRENGDARHTLVDFLPICAFCMVRLYN